MKPRRQACTRRNNRTVGLSENLIGAKAYSSDPLDRACQALGVTLIVPHRRDRKKPQSQGVSHFAFLSPRSAPPVIPFPHMRDRLFDERCRSVTPARPGGYTAGGTGGRAVRFPPPARAAGCPLTSPLPTGYGEKKKNVKLPPIWEGQGRQNVVQ